SSRAHRMLAAAAPDRALEAGQRTRGLNRVAIALRLLRPSAGRRGLQAVSPGVQALRGRRSGRAAPAAPQGDLPLLVVRQPALVRHGGESPRADAPLGGTNAGAERRR